MLTNATELRIVGTVLLQERINTIKNSNHKITKTREKVLEFFETNHKPVSAREIITHLHANNMSVNKTTVYRELSFLLSMDFIKEVRIKDDEMHYETTSMDHHHHVVCKSCDSVEGVISDDLESEIAKLEKSIFKDKGFKVELHMLEFLGTAKVVWKGGNRENCFCR